MIAIILTVTMSILVMGSIIMEITEDRKSDRLIEMRRETRIKEKSIKTEKAENMIIENLEATNKESLIEDIKYLNTLALVADKEDYIYTICNFNNSIIEKKLFDSINNNKNLDRTINIIRKVLIHKVKSL